MDPYELLRGAEAPPPREPARVEALRVAFAMKAGEFERAATDLGMAFGEAGGS